MLGVGIKTLGALRVKYFLSFISKVIENSENHVNQMKNVYQIDQNRQNEPKLTKVAGTQLVKMQQNQCS